MPSRIVSSAVTCVRMIVQFAAVTPGGQVGATSGVLVAPSSTTAASAMAGTNRGERRDCRYEQAKAFHFQH